MGLDDSIETGGERVTLEDFKGASDAPFEVVDVGEKRNKYPTVYLWRLKKNWADVCLLMGWEKGGNPVDFRFFRVAKKPRGLVKELQNKIVRLGGKLNKFGVDGMFGRETRNALLDVVDELKIRLKESRPKSEGVQSVGDESKPVEGPIPIWETEPSEPVKSEEPEEATAETAEPPSEFIEGTTKVTVIPPKSPYPDYESFVEEASADKIEDPRIREKLVEAYQSLPELDARLKESGLDINFAKLFDQAEKGILDVDDYLARAKKLRNSLILEDPRLKFLEELHGEIMPVFRSQLEGMDFSKMHTLTEVYEEIRRVMGKTFDKFEEKGINEKADVLIEEGNFMIFMAYFMAMFYDYLVILLSKFEKNPEKLKLFRNVYIDKYLFNSLGEKEEDEDDDDFSDIVQKYIA